MSPEPTLKGSLDAISQTGFAEGWAYDQNRPHQTLTISVIDAERGELAWGHARHYRADLASYAFGFGWCAFRLRLAAEPATLVNRRLQLIDRDSRRVISIAAPRLVADSQREIRSLDELFQHDPTVISGLQQLSGCGALFDQFLAANGPTEFVRAAYIYVLNRPADPSGLQNYATLLAGGETTPLGLLSTLADSEEFRSRPRRLAAPKTPNFPFLTAVPHV